MIKLGNYNTLKILRETGVGLFLGDDDVDDLLLPTKYVPEQYEVGEEIRVFCYLDHEERPIATTLEPMIKRGEFAYLQVAAVSDFGAFMEWGLEKHLLVPFREQVRPFKAGEWYIVYCYLDEKTFRLVGSNRTNKFLDNSELQVTPNEEVDLLLSRESNLGWDVIVNGKHKGLIFSSEVHRNLKAGDRIKGYVKQIRPDQKLDIVLQPIGPDHIKPAAQLIYDKLLQENGFINLHDKSNPEDIKHMFQMSKKTFKKAIGNLYKEKRITIEKDGIHAVK